MSINLFSINQTISSWNYIKFDLSLLTDNQANISLYPTGKNAQDEEFSISDEAWIVIEFGNVEDNEFEIPAEAAADLPKNQNLHTNVVKLMSGKVFEDKFLPSNSSPHEPNVNFSPNYFIELHLAVRKCGTYNFAGARIELKHNKLNAALFHRLLADYDDREVCQ